MRASRRRAPSARTSTRGGAERRARSPARARGTLDGDKVSAHASPTEFSPARPPPTLPACCARVRSREGKRSIPPPRFRGFLHSSMARGLVAYPGGSASRISHAEARRASHASCEVVRALGRGSRGPSRLSPTLHFLHIRHFSKTKVPTSPLTIFSPSSLALMYIGPRIRPHSASVILHGGRRWHVTRERRRG